MTQRTSCLRCHSDLPESKGSNGRKLCKDCATSPRPKADRVCVGCGDVVASSWSGTFRCAPCRVAEKEDWRLRNTIRQCEVCCRGFEAPAHVREGRTTWATKRRYCSKRCRDWWHGSSYSARRACAMCGSLVVRVVSVKRTKSTRVFCSEDCRALMVATERAAKWGGSPCVTLSDRCMIGWRDCAVCGQDFPGHGTVHRCMRCRLEVKAASDRRRLQKKARRKAAGRVDRDISITTVGERDGWVCHLCDDPIRARRATSDRWADEPTIDHLIPLSKGGRHQWTNVKIAHRHCNSNRGDQPIDEWNADRWWDNCGLVA